MNKLFDSVEAVLAEIDRVGDEDCTVLIGIASSVTLDGHVVAGDVVMTIVLDKLLAKDFMPTGFEDVAGGRVYRYAR